MGKNSSREIVGQIADALEPEPKNISEISKETGVHRNSVVNYLEALTNHKYIHELDNEDRNREFFIESSDKSTGPVDDIPEWSHQKRVEDSRIKMIKNKSKQRKDFS